MTELTREQQFDRAEEEFTDSESSDIIKSNRKLFDEAKALESIIYSPAGEALIRGIKEDISKSIQQLIATREGRYLSDLESNLNLLTKLTNAKSQADAIGNWLDSIQE